MAKVTAGSCFDLIAECQAAVTAAQGTKTDLYVLIDKKAKGIVPLLAEMEPEEVRRTMDAIGGTELGDAFVNSAVPRLLLLHKPPEWWYRYRNPSSFRVPRRGKA